MRSSESHQGLRREWEGDLAAEPQLGRFTGDRKQKSPEQLKVIFTQRLQGIEEF